MNSTRTWITLLIVVCGCSGPSRESIREALLADPDIAAFENRTGFEIPVFAADRGYITLGRPYPESAPDPDLLRAIADLPLDLTNAEELTERAETMFRKAGGIAAAEKGVQSVYWRVVDFEPPGAIGERSGEAVYAELCATCHGDDGFGDGPSADALPFPPANFVVADFNCRSTAYRTLPEDADLIGTITEGLLAAEMPGNVSMTPGELQSLVAHIKQFSRRWLDEVPGPVVPITDPPEIAPELFDEGRYTYMVLGCWQCHGPRGDGEGPMAHLIDEPIRPLKRDQLRCGTTLRILHRTLITGTSSRFMQPVENADLTFIRDSLEDRLMAHREHIDAEAYPMQDSYSETEIAQLRDHIATLPVWRQIDRMPAEEVASAAAHRRWALAAYVMSLAGLAPAE
ncbi:MAG: hypothetical protein CME06_00775 [Gemmatimonadetes bacterium]|nr:hypothetical protein [Gemmatimonadota bacterium]